MFSSEFNVINIKGKTVDINWLQLCYALVGGLGMFIYGMKLMSDGLQKSAGNSLKMILEKLTSNRVIGAFVGLVVTAIIQSSSATTVMVVGFVNAGLMNLMQALSVVLGANIGTTITAQIIAFKVSQFALPAIGIGVVLRLFIKGKKTQSMGEILLGFGFLFLGMEIMTKGFAPLNHSAGFKDAFVLFSSNPLLAVAAGTILTMIVQSSSATLGITIALATTGIIDFAAASALVLGENIGTTITANLAAIGTNKAARRAALGHLLFNLIGVTYMVLFLPWLMQLVDAFTPGAANMIAADGTRPNLARHIANVHTTFNIINTLIFLPILPYLARLCEKIIKGDDTQDSFKLIYLKEVLVETPTIAVVQAIKEVKRMSDSALAMLKLSKDAFFERNLDKINKIYELEESVDLLQKEISDFLVKLFEKDITEETSKTINRLLHVLHDIEKIGDYAENIARFTERMIQEKMGFSDKAMAEMEEIFNVTLRFTENVLATFNREEFTLNFDTKDENLIDQLRREYKNNHIARLNLGECTVDCGILFVDILNNLEKTGDNTFNIAQEILAAAK